MEMMRSGFSEARPPVRKENLPRENSEVFLGTEEESRAMAIKLGAEVVLMSDTLEREATELEACIRDARELKDKPARTPAEEKVLDDLRSRRNALGKSLPRDRALLEIKRKELFRTQARTSR